MVVEREVVGWDEVHPRLVQLLPVAPSDGGGLGMELLDADAARPAVFEGPFEGSTFADPGHPVHRCPHGPRSPVLPATCPMPADNPSIGDRPGVVGSTWPDSARASRSR